MEQPNPNEKKSEFLNKRIIITGASSGIGKACALYFLNSGAKVVLCGRDVESMKSIGLNFPDQAAVINVDLSNDLQIYDFKSSVIEILGGIDIIINCAGVLFDGDIEKTFPQDYDYTIDVNLRSVFQIMLFFKQYLDKGVNPCIVNVSCINGTKPQPGMISYCMSKAGLEMLTKFAAAEFAENGIRVNAVSSCPVDSNSQRYVGVSEGEYASFKDRVARNVPIGRMANPDDVAKAIIYLSSSRASKVTGQVIKVDGGRGITSSGFVSWKGLKNMNSRFEPDGVDIKYRIKNMWGSLNDKKTGQVVYPTSEDDIEKLLNEANWATRLSEAHEKVTANYKNIDVNDDFLQNRFVKK